ncbi:MAG: phosphoribosyltransferase family protein [Nitrosomonadales bacterium]|nr:phosphoribosyltransferase family protein [Nitrosomonadales bacterium]
MLSVKDENRLFNDRADAARMLANTLLQYKYQHPLVIAIPRGAVPMAKIIAEELNGDLDVVLVAKIPAPLNPELAIGSVTENGLTYIEDWALDTGADQKYIDYQVDLLLKKMSDRRHRYTLLRQSIDAKDRVAIIVDDGMATGATMLAAVHSVRKMQPRLLIVAVPVASPRALFKLEKHVDAIACLLTTESFHSVGQFYRTFTQVSDEEVYDALRKS